MSRSSQVLRTASDVGNVLVVDDELEMRAAVRRTLVTAGHAVLEAATMAAARDLLGRTPIDVVVLDLGLPDGSGLELLNAIKSSSPSTAALVFTASDAATDMREALRLGASAYLHKPADALTIEAQVSLALAQTRAASAARLPGHLGLAFESLPFHLARQLSRAWDLRHIETGAHVRRMAESTRIMALALGASAGEAGTLGQVALLHDIGKIAIPDAILTKPGRLTDQELAVMQQHAEVGGELLSGYGHPFLDLAATVARSHHERWNGSGYPDHLVGEECSWEARLVGVVDVFDALGHARCYKEAWSRRQLVEFFEANAGSLFDPEIVKALLSIVPRLEAVKSEYPDPTTFDYASGTRRKSAVV